MSELVFSALRVDLAVDLDLRLFPSSPVMTNGADGSATFFGEPLSLPRGNSNPTVAVCGSSSSLREPP